MRDLIVAREAFDYPVFMARPAAVGITATGDTGEHVPNDLPEVLAEWKAFIASLKAVGAALPPRSRFTRWRDIDYLDLEIPLPRYPSRTVKGRYTSNASVGAAAV